MYAILRQARYYRVMPFNKTFRYGQPVEVSDVEAAYLDTLTQLVRGVPHLLFEITATLPEGLDVATAATDQPTAAAHAARESPKRVRFVPKATKPDAGAAAE
jgi:hypothetical protein